MPEEKIHEAIAGTEFSKEWDELLKTPHRSPIEEIIYTIELCKETSGDDWNHNKKRLAEIISNYADQQTKKLEKEIERLKVLIKDLYMASDESAPLIRNRHWLKFKTENKL